MSPGWTLIGAEQKIFGGQALQHHRRRRLEGNIVRQGHDEFRLDIARRRIAAERAGVGHAVAGLEPRHPLAERNDLARALVAGNEGRRRRIGAGAEIDVEKIHADGVLADLDLARAGRRQVAEFLITQNLRPAGFMHADRLDHGSPPFRRNLGGRRSGGNWRAAATAQKVHCGAAPADRCRPFLGEIKSSGITYLFVMRADHTIKFGLGDTVSMTWTILA